MGLTLITPPVGAVISLDEAKAHCRVTHSEHDALIRSTIASATQFAEGYVRRALLTQTWRLTLNERWPRIIDDGKVRNRIQLPRPPVQSILSITYVNRQGVEQTLDPSAYSAPVSLDSGEWCVEPAFGASWPSVRPVLGAIAVTYRTGYGAEPSAVPESIRQALLLLIAHWRENPEAATAGTATEIPFGVDALLSQHRLFT